MVYINAILVLVIVYLVTKLAIEYKEMGQGKNAQASIKKLRTIRLEASSNQLKR